MLDEIIRLSLKRKKVRIILEDDGEEKSWTLRELDGTERNKFLNKMASRVKIGAGGKAVGIKSFDGFQADLLKMCLFDENGEAINIEDIEALPSSTQQELFKKAQQLCGLDKDEEKDEKND